MAASNNLIKGHHPSNSERGGVCIYYMHLKLFNINYLNECMCFEVAISKKLYNLISLKRSPSQSCDEFGNFISNSKNIFE